MPPATAGKLAFSPAQTPEKLHRTLTFAERVAYQYAIEEVLWRHRIWPKENPGPKPALEAVLSREGVERKVSDYLRNSQALADYAKRPITRAQLQAEMDRMAQHSGQPGVLRELFAALGNDPFVIAECLARPLLAERLISELTRNSAVEAFVSNVGTLAAPSASTLPTALTTPGYALPEILDACADDTWTVTSTLNASDPREGHTAVWTGTEMIIWGGFNFSQHNLNTGARYNPATDSWIATSTTNAPRFRWRHSAVWTGSEMIIWGGGDGTDLLNTGGRYNPIDDSWTAPSTINAPTARISHTAVWTGSEMIVWGGSGCGNNCRWNTGGRYNPTMDSWTATSTTDAPSARWNHAALWSGSEMIIWGGTDQTNYLRTGGRYKPNTDTWVPTAIPGTIPGRTSFTAVWSGSEMIVWGGVDETFNDTNTGGRYDPIDDQWSATSLANAPSPRDSHSAVWTGREMIIWGGGDSTSHLNTGARYDAAADAWRPTTTMDAPFPRERQTAIWTGNQMIVWGGYSLYVGFELNTGGRYCAQPSAPLVQSAVSRKSHGTAGSFDLDLPLDGTPGTECRSGGATGDYTIVLTFLANVSVSGNPQAAITSGIGTIGSGGMSNGGMVVTSGNVVTIPLTNVANAQTISVTLNNVNGSTDVTIPMDVLVGDVNGNAAVNASDVALIKAHSGQPVNPTTFRSDVTADGSINATDVALVKASSGTGLP